MGRFVAVERSALDFFGRGLPAPVLEDIYSVRRRNETPASVVFGLPNDARGRSSGRS